MTLRAMDSLLRLDPRLDSELVAPLALVRALHAFAGIACLEVALASAPGMPMTAALVPGLLLTTSALALGGERHWVLPFAVIAGWSGVAATLAGAIASSHLHPLVAVLIVGLLWEANALIGGAPRLDWRRLAAARPTRGPSDPYDGTIEEM